MSRNDLLVCYDVVTETLAGARRLRRVAKLCEKYGQRVQKSVFEISVSEAESVRLQAALLKEIDAKQDSVRIYRLRQPRAQFVTVLGQDTYIDLSGPLVW